MGNTLNSKKSSVCITKKWFIQQTVYKKSQTKSLAGTGAGLLRLTHPPHCKINIIFLIHKIFRKNSLLDKKTLDISIFLLTLEHNSNWNNMIQDFLFSLIGYIGGAILVLCGIVYFITIILVIIDVLRGNKIQGPFFW